MSNGTGQEYYQYAKDDPEFNVFTNCAEVDSQFFFSGPPYEVRPTIGSYRASYTRPAYANASAKETRLCD
jgi:hypothetical protein